MAAALWTTSFDASNLENSLFPRSYAMAERAWSTPLLTSFTNATAARLGEFRCQMMRRGVGVSPLFQDWDYHYGSATKVGEAGSCRNQ